MVSHCDFNLLSLIIGDVEHLWFQVPVGHLLLLLLLLLEKCLLRSSVRFKIGWVVLLLLSCMSSLCILDINPLLDMGFANIFYSLGCVGDFLGVHKGLPKCCHGNHLIHYTQWIIAWSGTVLSQIRCNEHRDLWKAQQANPFQG